MKTFATVIGFLLFLIGMLALCLSVVGVQLSYLTWIDKPGALFGLIMRLVMIIGGIVMIVISRTNWREVD